MAAVTGELGSPVQELGSLYKCAAANGLKKRGDGTGVVVAPGELSIEPVPAGQASTVAAVLHCCYNCCCWTAYTGLHWQWCWAA
jgi:hypothetical protein